MASMHGWVGWPFRSLLPGTHEPNYHVQEPATVSMSAAVSKSAPVPTMHQHVVLEGVTFDTYERLLEDLGERQIRLTYDRGTLEIMTLSSRHERFKRWVGRMVETMTLELGIPLASGGSTTWKRRDLEKGLESDECYWIQNEPRVRGRADLDLAKDPPPDLAIEVDVHTRSVNRLVIHAALGVPEVWRVKKGVIQVHLRQQDGSYAVGEVSRCFPWLPLRELNAWLGRVDQQDETGFLRAFQQWVRENLRP